MNYKLGMTQEWINGTDKETETAGDEKEFFCVIFLFY